ncbi:MAG: hypothetical protein K2H71_01980 [Muribaculaceae bacterium]|nr:hypothetical protein [Muribaculaceae bacterium]
MATVARINTRRKLIDIPEDVFETLNLKAAAMGTNLKKYIEDLLIRESEDMDDAELYRYLVATRPEGKIMLSESEKDDFERELGIGKYR